MQVPHPNIILTRLFLIYIATNLYQFNTFEAQMWYLLQMHRDHSAPEVNLTPVLEKSLVQRRNSLTLIFVGQKQILSLYLQIYKGIQMADLWAWRRHIAIFCKACCRKVRFLTCFNWLSGLRVHALVFEFSAPDWAFFQCSPPDWRRVFVSSQKALGLPSNWLN